ncbi:MAG: hypothetical protein OJF51_003080 [Nitrospira sp.]|jgi:hypothetical protein|nr:MAG: hypothetical protein OJF51_003080 [Nitrospira sp.]
MVQKPSSGVLAGHCRLTDSPARTNVVLFLHRTVRLIILRVADLAAALPGERRVSARWGWEGETASFSTIL